MECSRTMSLLSLSGGRKGGGGGGTIDEKLIIFSSLVPVLWLCLEVEFSITQPFTLHSKKRDILRDHP